MRNFNIKIIGIGGIGTILSDKLARFLEHFNARSNITLIDGDTFERKNLERQEFDDFGPKASSKARELSKRYLKNHFSGFDQFITEENISKIIKEGDIVFIGVDNHKTRKIISDYVKSLQDVVVISGGNEYIDGNVQLFIRKEGKSVTPSLTDYHPEIAEPTDKHPDEMSCEELENVEPQLLFTNLMVASIMCCCFYNVVVKENIDYCEVYFDILSCKSDSKKRNPKEERL